MKIRLTFPAVLLLLLILVACSPDPDQTPTVEVESGTLGRVVVDELEIQELAGAEPSYQVVVAGRLTNTCTRISEAELLVDGSSITVDIRGELLDGATCLDQPIDFQRVIPLDTGLLETGEYTVGAGTHSESLTLGEVTAAASPEEPPASPQTGSGAIIGLVWHDDCPNDPSEAPDHPGCIESGGVFIADGQQSAEETGIGDVRVELGQGECPSTGLARVSTGSDGTFEFADLESGTYCVSVNAAIPDNQAPLGDGVWTAPEGNGGSISVELASETESGQVAFGWDPFNDPEGATAAAPDPDCMPRAAYYGDVTIPDNTVMEPGEQFVKTWRIRNEGTCSWGPGYEI
ncbi:MAG: NBR1-Ig-like domain-containing protein, partial [Anaerolineales bacterium]|nr:NBR1-Ig-like domain-containing protein [Anaerolineales bacterium]